MSAKAKPAKRRPPAPVRNPSRAPQSSTRWWVLGGIAVVLVLAVLIALAAGGGDDDSSSVAKHEVGAVTVDGTPLPAYDRENPTPDPAVGDIAPTLQGKDFDEQPVTIGPTGTPQVVVFLAHWCPHCQAEVPRIVALEQQGAFDDIRVTGVATGTSAQQANYPPSAWLEREDWPFEVLVDSRNFTAAQAYGLSSYPFFVFLDGNGEVLGRATGEIAPDDLEAILDAMRDGEPLPASSGASSGAG